MPKSKTETVQIQVSDADKKKYWDRIGELRDEIDVRKTELNELLEATQTGVIEREVEIRWEMDSPRKGTKRKWVVGGECLGDFPMEDDDYQLSIDDAAPGGVRRRKGKNGADDAQAET